ncbi:sulfatase-like hydrolase/transferase [Pontiella agarivorans]|uniref:Sulfatase-like hydrolase/transferase n=1 Tax=Pontiella agarivorans TaxID=3038953 RepID=A0ABU5N1X3_9BACT|nr:sulfatase-like hydrolase/transferase [Pontiella agarivorans]MDZ8120427.1 sulfatase-like hydrolase/transferase [Pontiella agarivorans]
MKNKLLISALLVSSIALAGAARMPEKKPNIIFLLTDDQRWDSVGFMGQKIGKTPNLDQLASDGVVFDNAFVTTAICTPSRACYMLGQFERRHGIDFNSGTSMSAEAWAKSYPVLVRNAGYFTGYIGKNHLPIGDKGYRTGLMDRSFDFWYAGHHHIGFYPKDYHKIFDNAQSDTQAEILTEGVDAFLDPQSNEAFMSNAIQFLQKRDQSKPFMLSICMNLPHGFSTQSMKMKPTDDALYRTAYREYQDTLPLPPHYIPKRDLKENKLPNDLLLQDLRQTGYNWVEDEAQTRERMIRVMQAVTGIDRLVGNMRETLEKLGIAENTVIIYASDHGLFNGEFGLGGKSLCYETCMKVPMVIYDPRKKGGFRCDELVQSIDVAPTILSIAGVETPETMQGKDMTPLIAGEKTDWRDAAFGENLWSTIFGNPRCETVRTKDFRYIRYFKNDNRVRRENTPQKDWYRVSQESADLYAKWLTASIKGEKAVYEELYKTSEDPYEANNLINDPAYADVLKELRAKCKELVAEAKGDINTPPATVRVTHEDLKTHYRKWE